MQDLKTQKEQIAFYMQMLFDEYKSGNPHAVGELQELIKVYGHLFNTDSSFQDILRKLHNFIKS